MEEEKIFVTKSSMPKFEEYISEIKDIWDSKWLTNMGVKHKRLQEELKNFLGVDGIELVTNGHMALELSIQALGLTGEVITTPFTFASTTHAIVRNGLTPVFCDVNPDDFTIDTSKIESLITEKTSAIIPVHVYGNICNVDEIERIAKKHNLKVIYDAAHTFGVKFRGKGIGSFGDISCFSFHATKVFNTIEGGAVCFNEKSIGNDIYMLKNFGITGPESVKGVGLNAKMNEFCAAMGLCNLKYVGENIQKRKAITERYNSHFNGVFGLKTSPIQKDVTQNYAYYPLVIDESKFGSTRDEVCDELAKHNIFARKYFYPLTNDFECYKNKYNSGESTPVAKFISDRVLTLPLYPDLSLKKVDEICDIILSLKK